MVVGLAEEFDDEAEQAIPGNKCPSGHTGNGRSAGYGPDDDEQQQAFEKRLIQLRRMAGQGTALLSSYGAIVHRPLPAGARYVVDTGNLVAFDARMPYQVRKASRRGWLRSILSGEALVAEFAGPGELWLQTRNLAALAGALFPLFPTQQQGGGLGQLFE